MSGIRGDWTIAKRADGTGGTLEVAGGATFLGAVTIEGSIELPGIIIDHHIHDAGDITSGTLDPARLDFAVYGETPVGDTETIVNPAYVTAAITALNLDGTYATISALNSEIDATLSTVSSTYATQAALADYATKAELAGYSVVNHQHTVQPIDAIPASGIITLEPNKQQYQKAITGNTTIGFDATEIDGEGKTITFELLLTVGTTAYNVLFGSNITWLNGDEPYFNTPNTSYLCAFRSYDGGENWVGAYQGQF